MRNLAAPFVFLVALSIISLSSSGQAGILTGQTTDCYYVDIPDTQFSAHYPMFYNIGDEEEFVLDTYGNGFATLNFQCFYNVIDGGLSDGDVYKWNSLWLPGVGSDFQFAETGDTVNVPHVTSFPENVNIPDDLPLYHSYWSPNVSGYFNAYLSDSDGNILNNVNPWEIDNYAYLAFRIAINNDTTYGWVRLRANASSGDPTMIVYDYAVKDHIDVGIDNPSILNVKVFPNPFTKTVQINGIKNEDMITVSDLTGRILRSEIAVARNIKIDLSDISSGAYLLLINGTCATKIFKVN